MSNFPYFVDHILYIAQSPPLTDLNQISAPTCCFTYRLRRTVVMWQSSSTTLVSWQERSTCSALTVWLRRAWMSMSCLTFGLVSLLDVCWVVSIYPRSHTPLTCTRPLKQQNKQGLRVEATRAWCLLIEQLHQKAGTAFLAICVSH
mgnify:CR=1 FL=1